MINIRSVKLVEVRGIIEPLLKLHWSEVANYKDTIPLEPDWECYEALEKKDAFWACVVEEIHTDVLAGHPVTITTIIGYSAFFISVHPHYKSLCVAENDVLYLHPEYRKAGIGLKLITESERMLKDLGVQKIQWHTTFKRDFTPLLIRKGYIEEDKILSRML
jgi:GNAT superfamily N-acetyltransferase